MNDGKQPNVNAGTEAVNGFEIQNLTAVYLLFEKYEVIKDSTYYIFMEHKDDIVFCFLNSQQQLDNAESYQVKKSSKEWKLAKDFREIIYKITSSGIYLRKDNSLEKSDRYNQKLYFITNNSICLKPTQKGIKLLGTTVNCNNAIVHYQSLEPQIKAHTLENLEKEHSCTDDHKQELEYLYFKYMDVGSTGKSMREHLIGQANVLFGRSIQDHKAAVETIELIFSRLSATYNQNSNAPLSDKTKRVESLEINQAFQIITAKTKAYEYWRSHAPDISKLFGIPLLEQKKFELAFENSFDRFKDLKQAIHQNILKFVYETRNDWGVKTDHLEAINFIKENYAKQNITTLDDLQVKSAIYAAFFECLETAQHD